MQTIAKILKVELPISFSEQYFTKDTFEGDDYRNIILPNKVFANKDIETYLQVFNDRFPFEKDLCVLDALFNLGNGTKQYLESITFKD